MRILVCGSRRWTDRERIKAELSKFPPGSTVIHGNCKGADRIAGEVATELGFTVDKVPAQWGQHGLKAGPIRNRQMLKKKPDVVLAFPMQGATGTMDMIQAASQAGVEVKIFAD